MQAKWDFSFLAWKIGLSVATQTKKGKDCKLNTGNHVLALSWPALHFTGVGLWHYSSDSLFVQDAISDLLYKVQNLQRLNSMALVWRESFNTWMRKSIFWDKWEWIRHIRKFDMIKAMRKSISGGKLSPPDESNSDESNSETKESKLDRKLEDSKTIASLTKRVSLSI